MGADAGPDFAMKEGMLEQARRERAVLNFTGSLDCDTADEIIAVIALVPREAYVVIDLHEAISISDGALASLARSLTMAGRPVLFEGLPAHEEALPGYEVSGSLLGLN
jgi:hypothetical protein